MERLTRRSKEGHAYFERCFEEPCNGSGCADDNCAFLCEVCERLAEFEECAESNPLPNVLFEKTEFTPKTRIDHEDKVHLIGAYDEESAIEKCIKAVYELNRYEQLGYSPDELQLIIEYIEGLEEYWDTIERREAK